LEIVGEILRVARLANGDHGLDPEAVGDLESDPRALVVEPLHPVDDVTLERALNRQVLPGGAGVEGVRDRWRAVVVEGGLGDEQVVDRVIELSRLAALAQVHHDLPAAIRSAPACQPRSSGMTHMGGRPAATRRTLSNALRNALGQFSTVGPAMWGVMMTLSR